MNLEDHLTRVGADDLVGFGRVIIRQCLAREQAAQTLGIGKPTFVLCDHEFAAAVFANLHDAPFAQDADEQDKRRRILDAANAALTVGVMQLRSALLCSPGDG